MWEHGGGGRCVGERVVWPFERDAVSLADVGQLWALARDPSEPVAFGVSPSGVYLRLPW